MSSYGIANLEILYADLSTWQHNTLPPFSLSVFDLLFRHRVSQTSTRMDNKNRILSSPRFYFGDRVESDDKAEAAPWDGSSRDSGEEATLVASRFTLL